MWTKEFFIWGPNAAAIELNNISDKEYPFLRIRRWAEKVNYIIREITTLWEKVKTAIEEAKAARAQAEEEAQKAPEEGCVSLGTWGAQIMVLAAGPMPPPTAPRPGGGR